MRINADDFGSDKSVNSAIYKLASAHKIDSVSVIVNTPNFDINLLKKINDFGIDVGVHFNLISGEILSKTLSKQLNSKEFLGEDFWLSQKDLKNFIPGIKEELEKQLKKLRDVVKVNHADYHTVTPLILNQKVWGVYKNVCHENDLPYRGSNVKARYTSLVSLILMETIQDSLDIRKDYKVLSSMQKEHKGSYLSDYSFNCWSNKLERVLQKAKKDSRGKNYELIVHVADPNIESNIVESYENRCSQFKVLLAFIP